MSNPGQACRQRSKMVFSGERQNTAWWNGWDKLTVARYAILLQNDQLLPV